MEFNSAFKVLSHSEYFHTKQYIEEILKQTTKQVEINEGLRQGLPHL